LGPEGGARGGELVASGTPEQVAEKGNSYTGHALARLGVGKPDKAPRGAGRHSNR
jgi:excinuclease ABC subunit A